MTRVPHRPQTPVLALLLLAALGGCARYHPQPIAPTQTAAAFHARSLNAPGLRTFLAQQGRTPAHWPKQHWDLYDLTLVALYESPELNMQRAQWQRARAGIITAGQHPNPSLQLLSQHHSLTEAGVWPWTLGLAFDIPLETGGRRRDRIAQAQALTTVARLQVGETAWRVRAQVRQRLLDYCAALEQTKLLEAETATRAQMRVLMQRRLAVGESAALAVSTAQLALQRARLALTPARARVTSTRAALAQALGLPERALHGVTLSFAAVERAPTLQQLPSVAVQRAALRNRLDLRQALVRYAAAEAALKLQIARQYPDLRLGPGYEWEEGDNRWGIGLSLTLPLLNQNQGPIAEAKAHVTEAAATFTALQAHVIGQIDQALANYRGALQTLRMAQILLARQGAQQHLVAQQFAAGAVGRVVLLQARLVSIVTEQDQLHAQIQAQQALGALENAVQRPLGARPLRAASHSLQSKLRNVRS